MVGLAICPGPSPTTGSLKIAGRLCCAFQWHVALPAGAAGQRGVLMCADANDGPNFIPTSLPRGPSFFGYLPCRLWVIMQLMSMAFRMDPKHDCADMFAGKCSISKPYIRRGLTACALDIALDGGDDTRLH